MSQPTILLTIKAQLAANSAFTAIIPATLIYADKSAYQGSNQPKDPTTGLITPFVVISQMPEGAVIGNIEGRFYWYYFDLYFYDDTARDLSTMTAAAQAAKAVLNLQPLPDSAEAMTANQQCVRMPSGNTGTEMAFVANRLNERYRILIQRN